MVCADDATASVFGRLAGPPSEALLLNISAILICRLADLVRLCVSFDEDEDVVCEEVSVCDMIDVGDCVPDVEIT